MSLQDAMQMHEAAKTRQFEAEEAGDLIEALAAQRAALMWWGIVQAKYRQASTATV